jgi:DNA-binding GntR family transcriptional regulator
VRSRIGEQTYAYLRDAILRGLLPPGRRLNLARIATRLAVSKMPVKEAIARLEAEGLVEVQPRSGTYVARLDPRDVDETFDVRGALEALAAELACRRVTDEDVAHLRAIGAALDVTGRAGEVQRHVDLNFELHGRVVELAGNRKLAALYGQLRAATQVAAIHHRWQDWNRRLDEERREHEAIIDALARRDPGAAAAAVRDHIARGKAEVIAGLEACGGGSGG